MKHPPTKSRFDMSETDDLLDALLDLWQQASLAVQRDGANATLPAAFVLRLTELIFDDSDPETLRQSLETLRADFQKDRAAVQ